MIYSNSETCNVSLNALLATIKKCSVILGAACSACAVSAGIDVPHTVFIIELILNSSLWFTTTSNYYYHNNHISDNNDTKSVNDSMQA